RLGAEVIDHRVYVIAGDGCLSEGVSHEAASLAGHLGLDRLICFYDDNHITIDGPTELALSDDAVGRFRAYGWQVIDLGENAEDLDAIEAAIDEARAETERPSLIVVRSHIATPSPRLTDDPAAHGLAFNAADITETKAILGLPDLPFHIDDAVAAHYRQVGSERARAHHRWQERV